MILTSPEMVKSRAGSHAGVFVNLASTDFHFSRAIIEESFVGALQPIGHLGNDIGTDVADF